MKGLLASIAAALLLAGCASQSLSIRTVPDETPVADNAAAAANAAAFADASNTAASAAGATGSAGAAGQGTAGSGGDNGQPAEVAPPVTPAEAPPMYTYDPWERLNRFTYRFDARFDEAIFLPAANVYRRAPAPLRAGVHNFFGNLAEIDSIVNYTLQWRLRYGVRSLGRFLINSTIGIGGLLDVASKMKLASAPTGFATTLSVWGMHPGPYLVLPLLGPSTTRDGVGFVADYATEYGIDLFRLYRGDVSWGLGVANAVDQRANVNFRYYSTGSAFEYQNIRFLYVRKRLIEDEKLHPSKAHKQPADAPAGK